MKKIVCAFLSNRISDSDSATWNRSDLFLNLNLCAAFHHNLQLKQMLEVENRMPDSAMW